MWKGTICQIKQPSAVRTRRQQLLASGLRRGAKLIPSPQPNRRRKLRPREVVSSISSGSRQDSALSRFQLPPLGSKTALFGDLVVQISQHSSFDRDQYLQYQSSISTDSLLSTLPPRPDSGLSDSSPPWRSPGQVKPTQSGIIPDSQSLAGSSSYAPLSSIGQSSTENSAGVLEVEGKESNNPERREIYLTTSGESHRDQPEELPGLYVVESPDYSERFRKSQSLPTETQIGHLEPSWSRTKIQATFARSKSDTGSLTSFVEEGSLHSVAALERSRPVVSNLSSSTHSTPKVAISQSAHNSPYSGISRVSADRGRSYNLAILSEAPTNSEYSDYSIRTA